MHCGNLVIADSLEAPTIVGLRDTVGIANDVSVLYKRSTKLHNLLESVNIEHASSGSHIHVGLYGRFVLHEVLCRGKSIRVLLTNLESVFLQQYSDQRTGESNSKLMASFHP